MGHGGLGWLAKITPELPKRKKSDRTQTPEINSNARTLNDLSVCAPPSILLLARAHWLSKLILCDTL